MTDVSQILSVVDPTADSQPALERAATIARVTGAGLELLICHYNEYLSGDVRAFPAMENVRKEVGEGHERRLEELAAPLRRSGLTVRTTVLWDHPLHQGIVRHAAAAGADLVFKDTHHHSAIARALFSNTDWNLIRSCASPLWLVKPRAWPEKPVLIAAVDPMNEHDKPAALDDEIVMTAKTIAKATNADLHAFHAFDPRLAVSTATANAYVPVSLPFEEIEREMRERHGKRFSELVEFHDITGQRAHLVSGPTHQELPELARELQAALVVMGAVARNGLRRLFIGSTAERTLEHLPCDLLIVKPPWFRAEEEPAARDV
ncbi:MAG TPA: universal stress protein [Woeseiaceae bacterium]|nr:universal stress protein [Woeseiaceae bacterium]